MPDTFARGNSIHVTGIKPDARASERPERIPARKGTAMDELIVDLRHQKEILNLLEGEPELSPGIMEGNDKLDLMLVGDFPALD